MKIEIVKILLYEIVIFMCNPATILLTLRTIQDFLHFTNIWAARRLRRSPGSLTLKTGHEGRIDNAIIINIIIIIIVNANSIVINKYYYC